MTARTSFLYDATLSLGPAFAALALVWIFPKLAMPLLVASVIAAGIALYKPFNAIVDGILEDMQPRIQELADRFNR